MLFNHNLKLHFTPCDIKENPRVSLRQFNKLYRNDMKGGLTLDIELGLVNVLSPILYLMIARSQRVCYLDRWCTGTVHRTASEAYSDCTTVTVQDVVTPEYFNTSN